MSQIDDGTLVYALVAVGIPQPQALRIASRISGGSATWGGIAGSLSSQTDLNAALSALQATLVSGTSIRTVNGSTLLGAGDVPVQATLVSGTNLRTVNGNTLLGSSDIAVQATLVSGTNLKTVNGANLLGAGDLVVAGGGASDATVIAYSSTVPLDTAGFGKRMVGSGTYGEQIISTFTTFALGASPQADGTCSMILQGDGTHSVSVPGTWINRSRSGDAFVVTSGARTQLIVWYAGSDVNYMWLPMTAVDVVPPTLLSATVLDTDPSKINLVWSESINSAVSAASAFAVSSGHALSAHTYVDATHSYLTTSVPFIGGESKTLAYTQPGTNNMKDLAGNLLASFTGAAIVDNVTTPTLVSATVSNSTPGQIDLVWSESMSSTISAFSKFAVNAGHPLTAHTYVDATHTYLTTSTPFVASETKTLAYTPNGTNDMKDSAGSNLVAAITSFSITDGVASSVIFDELWVGSAGTAVTTPWASISFAPLLDGAGHVSADAAHGGTFVTFRNTSTTNYVLNARISGAVDSYPGLLVRTGSTGAETDFVLLHDAIGKLRFYEHTTAGGDVNIHDGVTSLALGSTAHTYDIRVTVSGTTIKVELSIDGGAYVDEIDSVRDSWSMGVNLSNTYVGITQALSATLATFGEIKAQ